jgi:hypothetical protein
MAVRAPVSISTATIPGHSRSKTSICSAVAPAVAHVPSLSVAVCPPTVEGLHVAVGGASVTVVVPSGQVIATAQADCDWA